MENLEVLKKCEGPNTRQLKKGREKISQLIEEVHPNPVQSEAINEIG